MTVFRARWGVMLAVVSSAVLTVGCPASDPATIAPPANPTSRPAATSPAASATATSRPAPTTTGGHETPGTPGLPPAGLSNEARTALMAEIDAALKPALEAAFGVTLTRQSGITFPAGVVTGMTLSYAAPSNLPEGSGTKLQAVISSFGGTYLAVGSFSSGIQSNALFQNATIAGHGANGSFSTANNTVGAVLQVD